MTNAEKDELIRLLIAQSNASLVEKGSYFGLSKDGEIRLDYLIKKYNDNKN